MKYEGAINVKVIVTENGNVNPSSHFRRGYFCFTSQLCPMEKYISTSPSCYM